jgi:hypothetical protein
MMILMLDVDVVDVLYVYSVFGDVPLHWMCISEDTVSIFVFIYCSLTRRVHNTPQETIPILFSRF